MASTRVAAAGEQRITPTTLEDPPLARWLFSDPRSAWLWLPLRLVVGWQWLEAGWRKFTDPDWMQGGEALRGFLERAVQTPAASARAPIGYDWYRSFIQTLLDGGHYTWFARLVTFSELLIGIALIVGAFTAIAAFGGGLLNWNFIMAGTASTNAMLFVIAILLILAWKTAGWIGLDRWLLPLVGTPWRPGGVLKMRRGTLGAERAS